MQHLEITSSNSPFTTLRNTGGESSHTLTANEMPSHRHQLTDNGTRPGLYPNWGTNTQWGVQAQYLTGNGGVVNSAFAGGGQAHNNMPPYIVVNYEVVAL